MSTHRAPAQRVPAWKRLGLKLKGAASGESPAPLGPPGGNSSTNFGANNSALSAARHQDGSNADVNGRPPRASTNGIKRNLHTAYDQTPNKRPRRDEAWSGSATGANATVQKLEKSVSFADGTKVSDSGDAAITEKGKGDSKSPKKNKKKKTKKAKAVKAGSSEVFSLEPALVYLRQWDTARESWKFNKNHQTLLIKYVFDQDRIPSADIAIFYKYIRDLKGMTRTRLRETAEEIKTKDMEQGAAGFPESTKDKEDKQKEYEEVLSQFIRAQQSGNGTNANGKRSFDEVEFVLRTISPESKQRVIKRMRAEMVLDELSDSEQSTTSSEATSTTASSSAARENAEPQREKRVKLNDGSQKVKRRRLRNVRTDDVGSDDSSSDESDSGESSDDSSNDSSSSEDSEDEEMPLATGLNGLDASSSSSSSSSSSGESESESDSDSGSESGAPVGAEGDSEDSDDE